ncbi:Glycosyl transferase family 10 [Trypanosoma melophagium]|uniref:Glycosyl transferase family 10 n=1 Tax=Trypanosoma melophagium TaxID=715481 RepID=UPI003519EB2D|nr:Glycosyl transferase family 10 [Trypanosoma melophagium]
MEKVQNQEFVAAVVKHISPSRTARDRQGRIGVHTLLCICYDAVPMLHAIYLDIILFTAMGLKLCVFRKYKYAMAPENSREKDYVTEKVYHALLSGAIPLYWGAPNIDDFLPSGRRSVVEVERFIPGQLGDAEAAAKVWDDGAGAFQKLGEFLQHLETDDAAVKQLLAWRHVKRAEEWGENFLDNMYHTDPICALCAEAREKRRKVEGGR